MRRALATGALEQAEGLLVSVRGAVAGWGRRSWTLDDGTGAATVVLRQSTGLRWPWLERGELRGAVGIVGRDEDEVLLLPRVGADIGAEGPGGAEAPMLLPATGGAGE